MENHKMLNYLKAVLKNMPTDWLNLTTHRLDIFEEKLAKTQFIQQFEILFEDNNSKASALNELPTAFDYIRLGHPLSCILEWGIAHLHQLQAKNVISFSSKTIPILAILRKNLLDNKNTQIIYTAQSPDFDVEVLKRVYGYKFELKQVEKASDISLYNGSTIFIAEQNEIGKVAISPNIDFFINTHKDLGSILLINGEQNESYIPAIQHVRRRETIAMTPANCLAALKSLIESSSFTPRESRG